MINITLVTLKLFFFTGIMAQSDNRPGKEKPEKQYWNTNLQIIPFRLPPPPVDYKPEYIDLDHDGDPDVIKSITKDNVPILWIDDDDDMQYGDLEGDTDSDCLS